MSSSFMMVGTRYQIAQEPVPKAPSIHHWETHPFAIAVRVWVLDEAVNRNVDENILPKAWRSLRTIPGANNHWVLVLLSTIGRSDKVVKRGNARGIHRRAIHLIPRKQGSRACFPLQHHSFRGSFACGMPARPGALFTNGADSIANDRTGPPWVCLTHPLHPRASIRRVNRCVQWCCEANGGHKVGDPRATTATLYDAFAALGAIPLGKCLRRSTMYIGLGTDRQIALSPDEQYLPDFWVSCLTDN
ncbi:hypothetical protein BD779DRAFT_1475699 [Infundibulicybe gibba]|nr:hypothetical protein BD779DRAFT_1475699 [Infundibulicybe gibba]